MKGQAAAGQGEEKAILEFEKDYDTFSALIISLQCHTKTGGLRVTWTIQA